MRDSAKVLVCLLPLLLFACGADVNQTVTLTFPDGARLILTPVPPPAVTPAPQSAPSGACIAPAVRVGPFGYSCVGVDVPSNVSGVLPRGCTAVLTATPKYGDGRDVPPELHG